MTAFQADAFQNDSFDVSEVVYTLVPPGAIALDLTDDGSIVTRVVLDDNEGGRAVAPLERVVGGTLRGTITVRDGNNQLYDPALLQLSFNKGDLVEDVLTYGGALPGDTQLTRASAGKFPFWYKLDVVATWRVRARWADTAIDGRPVEIKEQQEIIILVRADPHTFAKRAPV